MKPVPYDTYIVQYSYSLNNGSNNELIRIRRAATKYKVHLFKASEFLGIDKDDFDYKKSLFSLPSSPNCYLQYIRPIIGYPT